MTFKTKLEDNAQLNPLVAIPRKDLEKLEEARVALIEHFTKGLTGLELTNMMCVLEPMTRQMWLVANRNYTVIK